MRYVFSSLDRLRAYAPFLLRLAFAYELINAAGHTALQPDEGIPGYAGWLNDLGFPFPTVSAVLSAYTEFFGAILMALGWKARWAAVFLIINFVLAIAVAHIATADTYKNSFPAINLLAMSVFLLLNGPGRPSIDEGL